MKSEDMFNYVPNYTEALARATLALAERGRLRPIEERFWDKVNKDGPEARPGLGPCWVWTGAVNASGYGLFGDGSRFPRFVHRAAFGMCVRKIQDGLIICHHCDNPPCVNPAHLFEGTNADNSADKVAKGRQSRGPRRRSP